MNYTNEPNKYLNKMIVICNNYIVKNGYDINTHFINKNELDPANKFDWKNNISHQNDGRFAKRLLQWIKDEKIKEITFASLTQYKEDYLPRFTKSSNTVAHYINFIRKV